MILAPIFASVVCAAFLYGEDEPIKEAALVKHWIHAREEDKDGVQVYRAKGSFEPRPSRFRMEYDLGSKGDCRYMWLSPSDGHMLKPGSWKLKPATQVGSAPILEVREGEQARAYFVVELTKTMLRLKEAPQP